MKRKTTALFLAFALTLGSMPAGMVYAQEEVQTEAEAETATRGQVCEMLLKASDDYNPGVTEADIMKGFEDADQKVTRAEALVMLTRAFGEIPAATGNNAYLAITQAEFTDVPEWAAGELAGLFAAGIIEGRGEGVFAPDDPVTIDEMDLYIRRVYRLFGTNRKDDFYQAVNKEAFENTVIPEGAVAVGNIVNDVVTDQIVELVKEIASADQDKTSKAGKIKTLYENYLNKEARNEQGYEPLRPYLDEVDAAESVADLADTRAFGQFMKFLNSPDFKDSKHFANYFQCESINTKDVYDGSNEAGKEILHDYVTTVLKLIGYSEEDAKAAFDEIFAIKKQIAEASLSMTDKLDVSKTYNVYTLDEICDLFQSVDVEKLFEKSGFQTRDKIIVQDVGAMENMAGLLVDQNLDALKDYAKYSLVDKYVEYMSDDFSQAKAAYSAAQSGAVGSVADETQAAMIVNNELASYVGELYAEKYVDEQAKADITKMIEDMIGIYRERITNLGWMSDETKEKAIKKLDTMAIKVGAPDKVSESPLDSKELRSYEDGGSLVENLMMIEDASDEEMPDYEGTEVDRTLWLMSPQTVNCQYNPILNDVTVYAGYLQATGAYKEDASYEQNLGALGTVIGHEISHAFDINGSQYDENGNAVNWWTEEDAAAFAGLCQDVINFYDGQEGAPGIAINGMQTLTENTADLGGLSVVLELASRTEDFNYEEMFESWASMWMNVYYRGILEQLVAADTHALDSVRINRTLQACDKFYETYGITENDGMWVAPEDRVSIW